MPSALKSPKSSPSMEHSAASHNIPHGGPSPVTNNSSTHVSSISPLSNPTPTNSQQLSGAGSEHLLNVTPKLEDSPTAAEHFEPQRQTVLMWGATPHNQNAGSSRPTSTPIAVTAVMGIPPNTAVTRSPNSTTPTSNGNSFVSVVDLKQHNGTGAGRRLANMSLMTSPKGVVVAEEHQLSSHHHHHQHLANQMVAQQQQQQQQQLHQQHSLQQSHHHPKWQQRQKALYSGHGNHHHHHLQREQQANDTTTPDYASGQHHSEAAGHSELDDGLRQDAMLHNSHSHHQSHHSHQLQQQQHGHCVGGNSSTPNNHNNTNNNNTSCEVWSPATSASASYSQYHQYFYHNHHHHHQHLPAQHANTQ